MKSIYVVYPLTVLFAWMLVAVSFTASKIAVFAVPLVFFFWLKGKNVDIWMEPLRENERVVLFFLKNKEVLQFVGKKISEELVKIKNKAIRVLSNTMYIYARKPVLMASQEEDVQSKEVYQLEKDVKSKSNIFESRAFLKCVGAPLVAVVFSFFIPESVGCMAILGCSFVPLAFAYSDGALGITSGSRDEILCFYFSGARTIRPVVARLRAEGYADMPGFGKLRLADNTDYFLGRDKLFLCSRGVNHSFNLEVAEKAMWFKRIGLRDKYDLKEGIKLADMAAGYDSFEEIYENEGMDFIKECRELGDERRKELKLEAV